MNMNLMLLLAGLLGVSSVAFGQTVPPEVYVTRPVSDVMILPDTAPKDLPGNQSNVIRLVATPGEYEPASIVVRPESDIQALRLVASDLKRNDGTTVVSNHIDIKAVKCWYQAKGAWKTNVRMSYQQVLVPELLLNDDTLVRPNHELKQNDLRLTYASGEKYVRFDYKAELDDLDPHNLAIYYSAPGIGPQVRENFIFKDSPILLPVDIPAGTNKQFWITVHVPPRAPPGDYAGYLELSSSGKTLRRLDLKLTVLPFTLAPPKTYYDPSRDFTSSIYYRGELDIHDRGAVFGCFRDDGMMSDGKSRRQMKVELDNLYRHGVTRPFFCVPYDLIANDKQHFRDLLQIRAEAGITGPFYIVFDLLRDQQEETALKTMQKNANELMAITEEFGITEFYFYAIDEATGELLLAQRAAWEAIHDIGGKVCVAGYRDSFESVGDVLDLLVCNGPTDRMLARKWHSAGHQIWSYANPQGGIENPLIYRRNYGFQLWKAEYDGAATYCYQVQTGSWNDINDIMRDLTFAYPTSNGVVDTIAWEGYREAIDDIRYGSTLKLEIENAKSGTDVLKHRIADEAERFLENLDTSADLDTIRSAVIGYILKLTQSL